MEGNPNHDAVSKVKQSAISLFEKNSPPPFEHTICIFRDYSSYTQPFIKILCCLSVVFLSYGLVCEENPGKVLSPIVTSGSSPKFPNAILQSGITNPLIITI